MDRTWAAEMTGPLTGERVRSAVPVDTTPRLDPLRSTCLQPPYYGVPPLGHISMAQAFDPDTRAELASQVCKRKLELLSMCTFLNVGALINRLPVELLIEIFEWLQKGSTRMAWLEVLCVCRHWFAVGSTAATLWQNLSVETRTDLLVTGLSRSRAAELSIAITSRPIPPLPPLVEVSGLLTPHICRLRKLSLDKIPVQCYSDLVAFLENDMPALRCLQVSIERRDCPGLGREFAIRLSPATLPSLQELHTDNIRVFANGGIASQLRKIEIANGCLGKDNQLGTAALVNVLREMRNARVLSLNYVLAFRNFNDASLPAPPTALDRVALDHLEYAEIRVEGAVLKAILSAIVIPPTATVFFDCSGIGDIPYGNTPGQIIPADRTGCLPIISQVTALHARTDYEIHTLRGLTHIPGTPEPVLRPRVDLHVENRDEAFGQIQGPAAVGISDIIGVFYDAPLLTLDIATPGELAVATDWRDIFSTYPKLRSFTLGAFGSLQADEGPFDVNVLFSALDPGCAAATTEPALLTGRPTLPMKSDTVLCTDLERVILKGLVVADVDADALVTTITTCLENRKRVLGGEGGRIEQIRLQFPVGYYDEVPEDFLKVQTVIEKGLSSLVKDVSVYHARYGSAWDEE